MGKYKAMAKTVKKFKVKGPRKQLEKAKRSNNRVHREAMDDQIAGEEKGGMGQTMEVEAQKPKSVARKNNGRLRKGEMPFVGIGGGRNRAVSLAKDCVKTSIDQLTSAGVTAKRQLTKKKARKLMRNWRREQRGKERRTCAMETE